MAFTVSELQSLVARGAAFLDDAEPDWFYKVFLDDLDMGRCAQCILGQIYGDFAHGMVRLGIGAARVHMFGFDLPPDSVALDKVGLFKTYDQLAALWVLEIETRLQAQARATHRHRSS